MNPIPALTRLSAAGQPKPPIPTIKILEDKKAAIGVEAFSLGLPTLEEVFLELGDHEGGDQSTEEEGNEKSSEQARSRRGAPKGLQ